MTATGPRAVLSDAIRYWEPKRAIYDLALMAVVTAEYVYRLPGSRARLDFSSLEVVFVLAVLAIGTAFGCVLTHFFSQGIWSNGM